MAFDSNAKKTDFSSNSEFPDFNDFISSFEHFSSKNSESAEGVDNSSSSPFSNIDMNTIFKMKQIMDGMSNKKNDPRSNLLLSLKPYLRPSRKQKIDQYIQLLNMGSVFENFKFTGGENKS